MTIVDFESLSTAERILKLQDLWDELSESPDAVELTLEQKETLDRRLEKSAANPEDVIFWREVRSSIQKSK